MKTNRSTFRAMIAAISLAAALGGMPAAAQTDAGQSKLPEIMAKKVNLNLENADIRFALKLLALLFVFIWIRATVPRLRYDQLMRFGWKVLLPVATLNAFFTALVVAAT